MKREKLTRIEILRLVQILIERAEQYDEEIEVGETMRKNEKVLMSCFNKASRATLEELRCLIINNIHPNELTTTKTFFSEKAKV